MTLIFKIADAPSWEAACQSGTYDGSADDRRDGYIHFSSASQVLQTAEIYFKGRKNLLLIAVDTVQFGPELKWEPSRGGDLFPHLYAGLATSAVAWTRPLTLGADCIPMISDETLMMGPEC